MQHGRYALLLSVFVSTAASAQSLPGPSETRFAGSGGFMVSQPKEGFSQAIGNGYGGGGGVIYYLMRSGLLGIRFDISGFQYGHETKTAPLSETIGSRVLVDVNTSNSITALSWGAELAKPTGRLRPYVNFGYSALLFRTTSSIENVDSSDDNALHTTNFKDSTRAWVYGGGLRFQLGGRTSPVMLDTGLRYYRGGTVSYLREGGIQDNPDGSITMTPLTSKTPFLVYTIGVRVRIPYDSNKRCAQFLC